MTMATTSLLGEQASPPRPPAAPLHTAGFPSWGPTVAICLALALTHILLVWGHISFFYGDTGRWMHEVDRFAAGERLYRDFTWPYPPLAMWLLGSAARLVGTGVDQLWILTSTLFLAVVVVFLRYTWAVVPRDMALVTSVAGLIAAMAYAQTAGAALPLGSYAPAALVGGLLLIASVAALVLIVKGETGWRTAAALGACASLAVLTKQDFWAPALVTVLFGLRYAPARHRALVAATAVGPALVGFGVVLVQLGPRGFLSMLGGFGHVTEFGTLGLPSGRRLAAAVGATSIALWAWLVLAWPRGARAGLVAALLSGGVIAAYFALGGPPWKATLLQDLRLRGLSPFLPILVLAWLWVSRRSAEPVQARLATVLLVIAVAARARRGFQGVEWFHVMLELPAYVLAVRAVLGVAQARWQRRVFAALIPLACYLYWFFGRGPLTEREGRGHETVETPRGRIHIRANEAGDYRAIAEALASLDPGGTRPLFAFGYVGGWNYFMNRTNPTPAPQGFRLTLLPPDSILARAAAARPFAVDARVFTRLTIPDHRAGVFRWQPPQIPTHYMRFDRPWFDRLIAPCRAVHRHPDREDPFLVLYDCS